MKKLLCVDLGTQSGFAVGSEGHVLSGTWDMKPKGKESKLARWSKFRRHLEEIHESYEVTHVFYESVERTNGHKAALVFGGFKTLLEDWCFEHRLPLEGLPVGAIKKNFSGNGNASKILMVATARKKGFDVKSEDEADALAIFDLAAKRLGMAGLPPTPEVTTPLDFKPKRFANDPLKKAA